MTTKPASELMNIVIVGHVDHGKSTVVGRLLADTGSLPEGKLEQVKRMCERNAKPFEYAFLLDALKDEQAQGITIDSARCFFKSQKRHYIIIDAPGHIEFLKNMISGAARAEAAVLIIDAAEGVRENSRRHGYMTAMLGIKQLVVAVNKMDLVHYDEAVFNRIKDEYTDFLKKINVHPAGFIPISAREGDNLVTFSEKMPWYRGVSVLDQMDAFKKEASEREKAFRLPLQDVYKFTEEGDDRRIFSGTVSTGALNVGEEVVFLPSGKKSKIKTFEIFSAPQPQAVEAGELAGLTLETQIYVKPGELIAKTSEYLPQLGDTIRANIFWLGKNPMVKNKKYKLKLASSRVTVYLKEIVNVLDAASLSTDGAKAQIGRHDVAECILQSPRKFAFDLTGEFQDTSRFVIVDDYEISGGGIITENVKSALSFTENYIKNRDAAWVKSTVSRPQRVTRYNQQPKFIMLTGSPHSGKADIAKALELALFEEGRAVYYLGLSNLLGIAGSDLSDRDDFIFKLGEVAHLFTDSGIMLISSISDLDSSEVEILTALVAPYELLILSTSGLPDSVGRTISTNSVSESVGDIRRILGEESIFLNFSI